MEKQCQGQLSSSSTAVQVLDSWLGVAVPGTAVLSRQWELAWSNIARDSCTVKTVAEELTWRPGRLAARKACKRRRWTGHTRTVSVGNVTNLWGEENKTPE